MVTFLYTGLLGLFYIYISIVVIKGRWKYKVSLGAGQSNEIIHLVSAHSNFSSYTPFFIISIYLLEIAKLNTWVIHLISAAFVAGRILHFLAMKNHMKTFKFRKAGMMLTFWPMIIASSLLIYFYARNLLI